MSTYIAMDFKCGLCGEEFRNPVLSSTSSFGSPDLDLRPPQMQRSTMYMWVRRCPNCGYVHADIESDGKRFANFIKSTEYTTCEGNSFFTGLAEEFYKYGLILLKDSKKKEAYDAFLHAAWACDDFDQTESAIVCRNKAISLWNEELFNGEPNLTLRHIDLLRRTGRFTEAVAMCEANKFNDKLMKKIAIFQKNLCLKMDTGCYCVADCESSVSQ